MTNVNIYDFRPYCMCYNHAIMTSFETFNKFLVNVLRYNKIFVLFLTYKSGHGHLYHDCTRGFQCQPLLIILAVCCLKSQTGICYQMISFITVIINTLVCSTTSFTVLCYASIYLP